MGQVTFLLTDVESSTRLWEERPDLAGRIMDRHAALIEAAVVSEGGAFLKHRGEGDSTFCVFTSAVDAVAAAVELQRALTREPWPHGSPVKVRAALYTGEAELRDGDYHGVAPNRAGRLRALAAGGQTLCTESTREHLGAVRHGVTLRDLGFHRLRDVARAERVFQVDHPDLPSTFPRLRSLGVRHNLPAPRNRFVGRVHEIDAVRTHLDTARMVTLVGVGGCGKTRLALEVASGQLEHFLDGVFLADLAATSDPAAVAGTVANALGHSPLAIGTASGLPGAELIDFLSTRQVLLVLDNCEHVIDAVAGLVDDVLDRCPAVRVLATSREAFEVQGEQLYPLSPLGVPSVGGPPEAADAVVLFCDRASLADPGFVLTGDDASHVAEICRRLDGIPLALEIAAAQAAQLSVQEIHERVAERLDAFAAGRGRVARQQTLQAALDWSFDLLTPDEHVVFRRLGAFPGSFDGEAARTVCGRPDVDAVLPGLVRKSLVVGGRSDHDQPVRYRLLETVRRYTEEKLVEAAEDAAARDRHRDHYLRLVEGLPPERTYLDPDVVVRAEEHNLRAALAWSEAGGRLDLVARIAGTMNAIWIGDIRQGQRWLSLGLQAEHELEPEHRVRLLAVAAHAAVLAIEAQDGVLARRAVEAAGDVPGMWSSLANALLCLNDGIRYLLHRDLSLQADLEHHGQTAVALAPEPISRGLAWFWFGQARVLVDDLDGAADALRRASATTVPGGDMSIVAIALLAMVQHLRGDHEEAAVAAQEVFDRSQAYPKASFWAWTLYVSLPHALELAHQGRHNEALRFLGEQLDESSAMRTPGVMTSLVVALGAIATMAGDVERANTLLTWAGTELLRGGIRTPVDVVMFLRYSGEIAARLDADTAVRTRARAETMRLDDALALGLQPLS